MGSKRRVWVIAENGTAYFRAGFGENKIIGSRWFHISERPPHLYQVSAGKTSVWTREKDGTCWYRQNITDTYPEGTTWKSQKFRVTALSVGADNQVWMINRNSIEHRFRVTPTDPLGKGWEVVLSDCWRWISVRGASGTSDDVDEGDDVLEGAELLGTQPNSLLTKLDLSEVDIYSMYGQKDAILTPDSEDDDG